MKKEETKKAHLPEENVKKELTEKELEKVVGGTGGHRPSQIKWRH